MALYDLSATINRSGAGVNNLLQTITVEADSAGSSQRSVDAATAGTLTTRTDADTGVITLSGGHGLSSGTGDVFWNDTTTGIKGSRRGMTWTVSVNALTVDGGAGDDLPDSGTIMGVMVPVSEACVVVGNNAKWSEAYAQFSSINAGDAYVSFLTSAPADIVSYQVSGDNQSTGWLGATVGGTNPFAAVTTATITFSHGETSAVVMGAILAYS